MRDVIFQDNVFERFKEHPNYLGYVTGFLKIGEERKHNYPWIERRFGKEEADKLADRKITCAGTVIGTTQSMITFCNKMWEFIQHALTNNLDQGTMNYLVHNNLLPIENLIDVDCDSGAILTMTQLLRRHPIVIRDNKILRGDGGVPAVVHQYDRGGNVLKFVNKFYRDRNFQVDEKYTDTRSNLEQVRHLLALDKIDEAFRFFTAKIAVGAILNSNVDLLLKFWENLVTKPAFVPVISYFEILVQSTLATVENFSIGQLNTICLRINQSVRNGHVVAPQFVKFTTQKLLSTAQQSLNVRYRDICFFCTEIVNALLPDKNLYLLQVEAYRALGKKDEALAAYSKALELS